MILSCIVLVCFADCGLAARAPERDGGPSGERSAVESRAPPADVDYRPVHPTRIPGL